MSQQLRGLILEGTYKPGDAIPSEAELMSMFGTARGTARQAVDVLVSEGLVRRQHGKGTFVQLQPIRHSILNMGGFTDSLRGRAESPVAHVIEAGLTEIDGHQYFRMVRLRGTRTPERTTYLSLDTSVMDASRFPGIEDIDFEDRSLYQILREQYKTHPRRTQITLSTEIPSPDVAELLGEPSDGPALIKTEGSAFDQNDVEIEQIKVLYASRVEFNLTTAIAEFPGGEL
ncbi:MAG: GntR family transcriptional regulator [Actinomycetota bacterium]